MSRFIENLTPCRFAGEGFFKVPDYPYSATEGGLVYSYHQSRVPPAFFDITKIEENKYIHVDKYLAHRLVAMTFLKLPEGKTADECLVNHLNGLKYDNRKLNLEWTDYVGNSTHAYKTGLREDNRPVKTFDTINMVSKHFYSLQDCARFYGVNGGRVHGYLNRKAKDFLFLEQYLLVYEDEPFPHWDDWTRWRLGVTDVNHVLVNRKSRDGFIFQTRTAGFEYLNLSSRAQQKLVEKAKEDRVTKIFYDDWELCPLSRYQDSLDSLIDTRPSREERYANYEPKRSSSRPSVQ